MYSQDHHDGYTPGSSVMCCDNQISYSTFLTSITPAGKQAPGVFVADVIRGEIIRVGWPRQIFKKVTRCFVCRVCPVAQGYMCVCIGRRPAVDLTSLDVTSAP